MASINETLLQRYLEQLKPSLPQDKQNNSSYAFLTFTLSTILDLSPNEAIQCITDGGNDNAIDAIYIQQTESNLIVHIFQTKYRQPQNLNKTIGSSDVKLTIGSVEEIFIHGQENPRLNEKIKNKIQEIKDVLGEYGVIKLPLVKIYFVTNGELPNKDIQEIGKQLENKGNYEVYYFNTYELLNFLDNLNEKTYKVNIHTKGTIIPQDLGDIRGLVATINANELIKIYTDAGRDKVLDKNIRYFLGNNEINSKIEETATSTKNAKYFWFLNNGVSIVCKQFKPMDDASGNKFITLENPKIVNGGQTTKTLFNISRNNDLFTPEIIKDVFILVRIYETDDENLIYKITEGTNNQNPTFSRDLEANNSAQLKVKQYFQTFDIYLETKRNEYKDKKIPLLKIIKNDTVLQAYLALYEQIPHQAKSGKTKVFEDYFKLVFTDQHTNLPFHFYRSYQILNFVTTEELANNSDENGFLSHANLAIVYAIGKLNTDIKDNKELSLKTLEYSYNKAIKIIEKAIIKEQKHLKSNYSHNRFFKTANSTWIIQDLIMQENKIKRKKSE